MYLSLWGLGRWELPLESQTSVSRIDVHHVPLYQSTDSKNADVIRIRTSCTFASFRSPFLLYRTLIPKYLDQMNSFILQNS